ncbi:MAG TPA: hypothetical protein VMM13_09210, partial [Euzebya sp.]|nr:hypothetical protein [Euzebya sp.]
GQRPQAEHLAADPPLADADEAAAVAEEEGVAEAVDEAAAVAEEEGVAAASEADEEDGERVEDAEEA